MLLDCILCTNQTKLKITKINWVCSLWIKVAGKTKRFFFDWTFCFCSFVTLSKVLLLILSIKRGLLFLYLKLVMTGSRYLWKDLLINWILRFWEDEQIVSFTHKNWLSTQTNWVKNSTEIWNFLALSVFEHFIRRLLLLQIILRTLWNHW